MTVDFAISCPLVRPGRPRYPVLVHQAAALLHASFKPRLATTPLRFANPSPSSGWIEDFHLQAVDHARHTTGRPGSLPAFLFLSNASSPTFTLINICFQRMTLFRRPWLPGSIRKGDPG